MTAPSDAPKSFAPEAFDHWSETQIQNPFPMYDFFRQHCPVARSKQHGGFAFVSSYDGAKRVLSDFSTFSNINGMVMPARSVKLYPSFVDPPEHIKYRRVINRVLAAERIGELRAHLEHQVDELIDGFIEVGSADLADDLIRPTLPPIVMPLIGVPVEDYDRIRQTWLVPLLRRLSDPSATARATQELLGYLLDLIDKSRASPPERTAIGALLGAEVDGEPIPDKIIAGMLFALLLGGLDTTAGVTLEALYYLALHPADAEKLRRGELDWSLAIDEFLRMSAPSTAILRTVVADTELEGVALRQGEFIQALPGAANRDSKQFVQADRCVLDRQDNAHISFGVGPHICPGRFLARLEIEVFLQKVLERLPDYKPAPEFSPEYWPMVSRQMKALPVTFAKGRRLRP